MGNKDKTEKLFVACRDVFAELVNVLVYHGEKILEEEAMLPGPTESIYPGQDAGLVNQFQDYSMYEVIRGEVHALYTLENQSRVDYQMALRHAGYEGAAYRRQYAEKKAEEKRVSEKKALGKNPSGKELSGTQGIYPVISMVLNWGDRRWTAAATVRGLLDYPVHEAAEDYLDGNRMHVFDMPFLDGAVRERFEGDVRVVLDYLSDRESLIRRRQKLRNPEEVMRMLHALSGDVRYLENIIFVEGGKAVCDLLDEMVNKGIEQGKQEGIKEGIKEGMITTCKEFGATFAETSARLKEKFSLDDAEVQRNMAMYW